MIREGSTDADAPIASVKQNPRRISLALLSPAKSISGAYRESGLVFMAVVMGLPMSPGGS